MQQVKSVRVLANLQIVQSWLQRQAMEFVNWAWGHVKIDAWDCAEGSECFFDEDIKEYQDIYNECTRARGAHGHKYRDIQLEEGRLENVLAQKFE